MQVEITVKVEGKVVRPFVEQAAGTFDPNGFNPQSVWGRIDEIGLPSVWLPRAGAADAQPDALNCDGAFDGADIDPFFLALADPNAYATRFPDCDRMLGDMNGDNSVDGADIDPFFICLGGGQCP